MNIILVVLLEGVYDKNSILSCLRGTPHIVKEIWFLLKSYYKSHIKLPEEYGEDEGHVSVYFKRNVFMPEFKFLKKYDHHDLSTVIRENINGIDEQLRKSIKEKDCIFPKPAGLNVKMMPYIYGGQEFKDYNLPNFLKPYFPLIRFCRTRKFYNDFESDKGKIFYLTIQEGWVEPSERQRRSDIHTDNPGSITIPKSGEGLSITEGKGNYVLGLEYRWGGGWVWESGRHEGGIFVASNVSNLCRFWDCKIARDEQRATEVIGEHGCCEHLKDFLPNEKEHEMKANCLYWITDRTPHEWLPLKTRTYRQYFRVVTENVSHWFVDHSTPSPCGVLPDPNITKIVKGNKFRSSELEIIDRGEYLKGM